MKDIVKIFDEKLDVKILCYGDSITYGYEVNLLKDDQVPAPYPFALEKILKKKLSKSKAIKVLNKGYNGWTSQDAYENFEEVLGNKKYDIVFIMFGINDVNQYYMVDEYIENIKNILEILKKKKIEPVLLTPTPTLYFAEEVRHYSDTLLKFAKSNNIKVIDMHYEIENLLKTKKIEKQIYLPDNIHFATENYKDIAEIILKNIFQSK